MPITADFFLAEPISAVIGPQIGPMFESAGVKITIALPGQTHDHLTCYLCDPAGAKVAERKSAPHHAQFRNFVFVFEHLEPGKRYSYKFLDDGRQEIDLEGGLSYADCWFDAPSFNAGDRFVLLSCNNPFESKKHGEARFQMWAKLHDRVTRDPHIKLLVQGGDQLYNDDIEADSLEKLRASPADTDSVYQNFIRNYQHYYGDLHYRKIMAHLPSVAMLDDHDITDGWGGRPASFDDKGSFRPEWQRYFDIAYEAFEAYQSIRNPDVRLYPAVATTYLDFGPNRLYLLDLRKEKNIRNAAAPLVSDEHAAKIMDSIAAIPDGIRNVFVLSPVVPVRINPTLEEELGGLAALAYWLRSFSKDKLLSTHKWIWFWSLLLWLSNRGGLADLSDDLSDGLSSSINRRFLLTLLGALARFEHSKNVILVSGDVHTGGFSEIFVRHGDSRICIPQVVSSPIGYVPMEKIVKDKTTEEGEFGISLPNPAADERAEEPEVRARNIFYRSDRNFAVITPGRSLAESKVEFTFESLSDPIAFAGTFLPT